FRRHIMLGATFAERGEPVSGGGKHGEFTVGNASNFAVRQDAWRSSQQSEPRHPQRTTRVGFPRLGVQRLASLSNEVTHTGAHVPPADECVGLAGNKRQSAESQRPLDGAFAVVERRAKGGSAPERTHCTDREYRLSQITPRTGGGMQGGLQLAKGSQLVRGSEERKTVSDGLTKAVTGRQSSRFGTLKQQGPPFCWNSRYSPMLVERGLGQFCQVTS